MYYNIVIIITILLIVFFVYKYLFSNKKKFKSNITSNVTSIEKFNKQITVILCYAKWCGHCPAVKQWFSDLVKSSPKQNIEFKLIEEKELPNEIYNKIEGFPTILVVYEDKMTTYQGARTREDLLNYLENYSNN
jgi:thiol-disulfide isomerase/thioredoxin